MLNYEEMKEKLVNIVAELVGEDYEVTEHKVAKTNVVLDSIIIKNPNINIAPTIYIEPYYQMYRNGMSLEAVAEKLVDVFHEHELSTDMDISNFSNFELQKQYLRFKVINFAKNIDGILKDVPYVPFLDDLAIVFYLDINDICPDGTIMIHNEHLKMWDIDTETLYRIAVSNNRVYQPAVIEGMSSVMKEMGVLPDDFDFGEELMYVMSNPQKRFGASTLVFDDVIGTFADEHNSDLWIIPSSIHETIIIFAKNDNEMDKSDISEMIQSVNGSECAESEVLGTKPFYYSRKEKKIIV